ncbi:Uncharacterized conserved protein [Plasmopara halstedii]|uniref:Uncharacterized conserved protein n=1 Tax=Plasmopara halstedii TaxID=4781 RepID=A0A0P1AC02_PLAHL|nr:Uncharacterized conserved protein [Plasmopara halstedii]CEG38009.1 Uncharacterized conserved protein [Plasmopara halstedii]|eukprot:XP_024574378.1 Uncharacterized conserved protein [Plasmopara halstedii]
MQPSISKPARHRRRTRHNFHSCSTAIPVQSDNPSDVYEKIDTDEHVNDPSSIIPAIKIFPPFPPTLDVHLPPLHDVSSSASTPLRAVGFSDTKAKRSGLHAKDAANQRTSRSKGLARRPSGRRWRAHPSDYDEVVAQTHLYKLSVPPSHTGKRRVAVYYTCEQIALFKFQKWISTRERRAEVIETKEIENSTKTARSSNDLACWKSTMYLEVLHLSYTPDNAIETNVDAHDSLSKAALQQRHILVFETGCCVFWGFNREQEDRLLKLLTPFSSSELSQIDAQVMEYSYGDRSSIAKDAIVLCTNNVAEMIALSFAMAQSATLSAFETRVGYRIRSTKNIPSSLSSVGSLRYSHNDTSKLIGQIFIELADVNIHSNVLDEPEYFLKFQDNNGFKYLYEKMLKYQDVANRVVILNKRLSILRDLFGVLNQQLTHHQGSKLEWIIIWMLVFQVVIAIGWEIFLKDIVGYFHHG